LKRFLKISQDNEFRIGNEFNHQFYENAIKTHGISHLGVHWLSKYTQYKRFEVLTYFIKDHIKESTIVDAGCGFGEYYVYLEKNELLPNKYIGVDIEDQMIKLSKKRLSNIEFHKQDILSQELIKADYYICSGAMNILKKEEMFTFIHKCFEASKKGFAFNLLKEDSLNMVSVDDITSFCKKICKKISIQDNYLQNDISIFIEKT